MMQANPFSDLIPAANRPSSQPLFQPLPQAQTPDQAAITRETAIRMHDQNQHIDPDTLRMMAQRYVMDGTQPNFGMGNAVDRRNFWEAVGHEVGANGGTGADLAVRIQQFRNGMTVIRGLEQQLENISGNERTAIANGEVYAQAASQQPAGTQTNFPILNSISRALGYNTGNADIPATAESRNTFANEYARVVSSTPSGSGQLTDSAREQALAAFGPNLSPDQRRATLDIMRLDMNNRVNALRSTIQEAYARLRQGQPISATPNGDLLDEHGQPVPIPGVRRNTQSSSTPAPPVMGAPPGTPPAGGIPPGSPSAPPPGPGAGGEHMDVTQQHMGPSGDAASLNTAGMERVADPALAGLNEHVAEMMNDRSISPAQIRQYIEQRGVPWNQVQGEASLAFRAAHPDYQWRPQDIRLDQQLAPVSAYRNMATNIADTGTGAALISAGNMVAGQQLPALVGATGGDAELARLGIGEVQSRHPVGTVLGDIGGAALTYGGMTGGARAGMNAAERIAPSLYARLPAWVRAGSAAGEAEAAASGAAPLAPTATFAPRAIAGDAALGAYESPGDRLEGGLVGGLTGLGARGTINTVARGVSPTGGALAPAYAEGVVPTVGQRMGGAVNRIEQAFQSVPILGGIQRGARNDAVNQWQLGGFNRALRNLPSEDGNGVQLPAAVRQAYPGDAAQAHAFAQDQFDNAYTRVHQRINVVPDTELKQQLEAIRQEATNNLSDPTLNHFNRVLDNSVLRRLDNANGEALTGGDLQDMLSTVRRVARSARSSSDADQRELAPHLEDVAQTLYDNAAQNSPPEAIATLGNINRGYGMLTRIESAANRTSDNPGSYTGRALMDAERRQGGLRGRQFSAGNGLMTDYAQAGMKLGQTVADSGTGERLLATAGAAGAGALPSYVGTAGILPAAAYAADTLATLPGARNAINWALKPNNPAIRPFTDALRAQLQQRAGIASTIGLPAVVPPVIAAYQGQP